jgi:hypothetical protein
LAQAAQFIIAISPRFTLFLSNFNEDILCVIHSDVEGVPVLSRSGVPRYQTISLDRAARLTGEAFGFEDATSPEHAAPYHSFGARALWLVAGLIALGGLAYIALR